MIPVGQDETLDLSPMSFFPLNAKSKSQVITLTLFVWNCENCGYFARFSAEVHEKILQSLGYQT